MAVLSKLDSPGPKILPTLDERFLYDLADNFASIIGVDDFKITLVKYDNEMWCVSYNSKGEGPSISVVLILYEIAQNEDEFGKPIPVVRVCCCNVYPTGQGWGTKIFKTILAAIRQTNYKRIIVTPSSDRAESFWRKMGFSYSVGNMILDLLPESRALGVHFCHKTSNIAAKI